MKETHSHSIPPYVAVIDMMTAGLTSRAVYVAAKLKIADFIGDGAKSAEELAKETKTHGPSLYRLLRALASLGLFAENEKREFRLTETGKTLKCSHPHSVHAVALLFGEPWHWKPWGELLYCIQTGKPSFEKVMGATAFDYFSKNAEAGKDFNDAMTSFTGMEATEIATAYDFSKAKTVVDIAGGVGGLLITLLKTHPHLKGILFDLPFVTENAKKRISEAGLQNRCEVVSGDFFKSVPAGGDVYLMKSIIHDWDDEHALTILKNCYHAMEKKGTLLLAERVIPPGNEPFFGKVLDLEMLVMTQGGKERTEAEYRKIYADSGFKLTRLVPTRTPLSLVEGVPR